MRKTNIYIAITTYSRPKEFKLLMEDVLRETAGKNVHISVYDDNSSTNYVSKDYNITFDLTKYGQNNGKKGYGEIIHDVFQDAKTWKFDYFFLLQDDCRLVEGFFEKSILEFKKIPDKNKATLNTFTPDTVYHRNMWGKTAEDIDGNYLKGNYVDCIFMCPRETLELLDFTVESIPLSRFKFRTNLISSGVGQQLSMRLARQGKSMWNAWSSLIISHSNKSKMNPEEREKNPLTPLIRDREYLLSELLEVSRDRVVAGMATIKSRENILANTIESIIDQVDALHIYLNDHDRVPACCINPKITTYLGKIFKDRGDTGKFFCLDKELVEEKDFYFFSIDDDMIYPEDYVDKTVSFLIENNNKVIATHHGSLLKKGLIDNYYRDRRQIHFSMFQREPQQVDIGGTGVMAFHTNLFVPDLSKFMYPNMSDIWLSIQAKEQNIPIMLAPKNLGWIKAELLPQEETIYGSKKNHDTQTSAINDFKKKHGEFSY